MKILEALERPEIYMCNKLLLSNQREIKDMDSFHFRLALQNLPPPQKKKKNASDTYLDFFYYHNGEKTSDLSRVPTWDLRTVVLFL